MSNDVVSAILLISGADKPGLVAATTEFIHKHKGNILDLHQYVDQAKQVFFMRVEWDLTNFTLPRDAVGDAFEPIAWENRLAWRLHFSDEVLRMAILVSKHGHCLYDLLARWQSGDLRVEIPLIISNHPDMEPAAQAFGIPYYHIPITKATKAEQEEREIELLKQYDVDLVVLARYMQVLTGDFIAHFPNRVINIHHSSLPAFPGAKPYQQAYNRGVKVIGATSHYVTVDLDEGPIIEQDITRVSHQDSVKDLIRKGSDLEKTVLSRAVYKHLQHRILVYENKTVVFRD